MEEEEPSAKRKKQLTGKEIIDRLESHENDVKRAVAKILEELCPFDINDEDALKIEDRVERLQRVSKSFEAKVYKLRKEVKQKKYRHNQDALEDTMISCSQYSVFDSQEVSEAVQEIEDEAMEGGDDATVVGRPEVYEKKPLDMDLSSKTRRRRVAAKRELFSSWAEEEKVTVTQLLGYLLYVENWMKDKSVATVGWKIFKKDELDGKARMTLEEAIWLREKSGMSEKVLQEVRLRLLDRYVMLRYDFRICKIVVF